MALNCLQSNIFPQEVGSMKILMDLWSAKSQMVCLSLPILYHAGAIYLNPNKRLLKSASYPV
jgi:hypothetical protein